MLQMLHGTSCLHSTMFPPFREESPAVVMAEERWREVRKDGLPDTRDTAIRDFLISMLFSLNKKQSVNWLPWLT